MTTDECLGTDVSSSEPEEESKQKKKQRVSDPPLTPPLSVSVSFCPTWWCTCFDGGWHIGGAALGWHGKCHLLLFMFSQSSLNCFCVNICEENVKIYQFDVLT